MKTLLAKFCGWAVAIMVVAAAMPALGAGKAKLKGVGRLDGGDTEKVGKYTWVFTPSIASTGFGARNSDDGYVLGVSPAPSGAIAIPVKLGGKAVQGIGEEAFAGSKQLTRVTIPDGVTVIKAQAFRDCKGLASVTIPNSVTSIGSQALKSIHIPNGVTVIDGGVFRDCKGLTSVTIPDSVKSIEGGAFRGCTALKSINIPKSVESIDDDVFSDCDSLAAITVDADNPNYSSKNGLLLSKDGSELISGVGGDVAIPDGTRVIKRHAFAGCDKLLSVTIPPSVRTIEPWAFDSCKNLKSIVFAAGEESEDGEEPENTIVMSKEALVKIRPEQCVIYIPKYVDAILYTRVPGVWEGFTVEYIPDETQGKAPSQWVSTSKKPGASQSGKAKASPTKAKAKRQRPTTGR